MRRLRLTVACYVAGGLFASAIRCAAWLPGGERRGLDPYGRVAAVLFTVWRKLTIIGHRW